MDDSEPVVDRHTHIPPEDYYRAMGLFDEYVNAKPITTVEPELEIPVEDNTPEATITEPEIR